MKLWVSGMDKNMKKIKKLTRRSLDWFIDKIASKKIYRVSNNSCACNSCHSSVVDGLWVHDIRHAEYIKLCQDEMGARYSTKSKFGGNK